MKQFDERESYDELKMRYDTYLATGFENLPWPVVRDCLSDGIPDDFQLVHESGYVVDKESLEILSAVYHQLFQNIKTGLTLFKL